MVLTDLKNKRGHVWNISINKYMYIDNYCESKLDVPGARTVLTRKCDNPIK